MRELDAADVADAEGEAKEWQKLSGGAGRVAVGSLRSRHGRTTGVRPMPGAASEVRVDRRHRVLGNPFELDEEGDTALRDAVCDAYEALLAERQHDAAFVCATAERFGVHVKPGFEGVTGLQRESAMQELALRLKGGESLRLMCHCHPRRCHAHGIAKRLRQISGTMDAAETWLAQRATRRQQQQQQQQQQQPAGAAANRQAALERQLQRRDEASQAAEVLCETAEWAVEQAREALREATQRQTEATQQMDEEAIFEAEAEVYDAAAQLEQMEAAAERADGVRHADGTAREEVQERLNALRAEQLRQHRLEGVDASSAAAVAQAAARADLEALAVEEGGDEHAAAETEPSGADSADLSEGDGLEPRQTRPRKARVVRALQLAARTAWRTIQQYRRATRSAKEAAATAAGTTLDEQRVAAQLQRATASAIAADERRRDALVALRQAQMAGERVQRASAAAALTAMAAHRASGAQALHRVMREGSADSLSALLAGWELEVPDAYWLGQHLGSDTYTRAEILELCGEPGSFAFRVGPYTAQRTFAGGTRRVEHQETMLSWEAVAGRVEYGRCRLCCRLVPSDEPAEPASDDEEIADEVRREQREADAMACATRRAVAEAISQAERRAARARNVNDGSSSSSEDDEVNNTRQRATMRARRQGASVVRRATYMWPAAVRRLEQSACDGEDADNGDNVAMGEQADSGGDARDAAATVALVASVRKKVQHVLAWHIVRPGVGHIDVAITFLGRERKGAFNHALRQLPPAHEYWLQASSVLDDDASRYVTKQFEAVGFRITEAQAYLAATGRTLQVGHWAMRTAELSPRGADRGAYEAYREPPGTTPLRRALLRATAQELQARHAKYTRAPGLAMEVLTAAGEIIGVFLAREAAAGADGGGGGGGDDGGDGSCGAAGRVASSGGGDDGSCGSNGGGGGGGGVGGGGGGDSVKEGGNSDGKHGGEHSAAHSKKRPPRGGLTYPKRQESVKARTEARREDQGAGGGTRRERSPEDEEARDVRPRGSRGAKSGGA
jgi:hypothetical protein